MEGNWNGAAGSNKIQYNGKEWNDDFGLGLNDYGARWYASDAPRWTTIDPLAEKYYSWSPYNYVMNNPVNMIDPDGRNSIYTIDKDEKNGGGTITIKATVFLTGKGASQKTAEAANNKFKEFFKDGNYKDDKGNNWSIKYDVNYEYNDSKKEGDLKEGENLMVADGSYDRSEMLNEGADGINNGFISNTADATEIVHETGHLLGLGERYTDDKKAMKSISHEGYEKDLMGASPTSSATEFKQEHHNDFGNFALRRSNDLQTIQYRDTGKYEPVTRFQQKNIIDSKRQSSVKKN